MPLCHYSQAFMVIVLAAVCAGCQRQADSTAAPSNATAQSADAPDSSASSGEHSVEIDLELEEFARRIALGIAAGKPRTIADNLDWSMLVDRISAGIEVPKSVKDEFLSGVRQEDEAIDNQLAQSLAGSGDFAFLRLRKKGNETRALYRMVLPNMGGINYFEMLLAPSPNGKPAITDIYIFVTGEDISQNMRRIFLAMLQQKNRGLLDRLTGKENTFVKHMPDFNRLTAAVQAGDGQSALEIYRSLPEELQQEKTCLSLRLRAAQAVSDEEYAAAIDAMRRKFGRDPSLNLLLIDAYVMKEDYAKAIKCVDTLDEALGGDPYLDCTRANLYLELNDLPAAKAAAERAIQALPNFSDPYLTSLVISLREKRFDDVLALMTKLQNEFGMEFEPETNEMYEEFRESPQFATWQKTQAAPAELTDPLEAAEGSESDPAVP